MKDFGDLHGRYAPAGDCKRQPQIVVDADGMTFEVAATKTRVTNHEFAASFFGGAGDSYEGISSVFFRFRNKQEDGYPIIMMFVAGEKKVILTVDGQVRAARAALPLPRATTLWWRTCPTPRDWRIGACQSEQANQSMRIKAWAPIARSTRATLLLRCASHW